TGTPLEGRDDVATLQAAAQHGKLGAVRLCLDLLGVDVNSTNDKKWTALHFAAGNGQRLVGEERLARGASLSIKGTAHDGPPGGPARWAARPWPTAERTDVARLLGAAEARADRQFTNATPR